MKKLLLAALFLISATVSIAQPIGGKNATVQVLGGMRVDSALTLPWSSAFRNKGADTTGRLFISTVDSLPRYMKKGVSVKAVTQFDSNRVYIAWSQKGVANGVATLDASGLVPTSQIPSISASDTVFVDTSMAQMLSHVGSSAGIISVRTDSSLNFILARTPATSRANWVLFQFGGVLTFNTRGGSVVPRAGDYVTDSVAEGVNNLYFTNARAQAQIYADTNSIIVTPKMLRDSVSGRVKYTDTASMLSGYSRSNALIDTASAHRTLINARVKYTDTSGMLTNYLRSYLGLKYSDTAGMLSSYWRSTSGLSLSGEVTGTGTAPTSIVTKLTRINNNVGTFGNSTNSASIVVDSTGRISAVVNSAIDFPVTQADLDDTAADIRATISSYAAPLNTILTSGATSNQNITLGKKKSLFPYSSTYLGINPSDSSGRIVLTDTAGSGVIAAYTTVAAGPILAATNNFGANSIRPSSTTMSSATTNYYIADSNGIRTTLGYKAGKVTAINAFSSVLLQVNSIDSSGLISIRDTAQSVAINLQASTSNTSIIMAGALAGANIGFRSGGTAGTAEIGGSMPHLIGGSSTPTIVAHGGAGLAPTITVTGTDLAGYITLTAGGGAVFGDTIATVTFSIPYFSTAPRCVIITPADADAGNLTKQPFVDPAMTTINKFELMGGGAVITAPIQYKWCYMVIK